MGVGASHVAPVLETVAGHVARKICAVVVLEIGCQERCRVAQRILSPVFTISDSDLPLG